jgi:hypothetical protein
MRSVEHPPALPRLLAALALAYLLAGLAAMLWLSAKVPYADGWRLLGEMAGQAFPGNLVHAGGGHREVLPNLVRLVELRMFGANQWLQIGVGAALALATALMLVRAMRMLEEDALRVRAAVCAALVALFWLGSQRTLAHGHEAVHAYLVTLCLAIGLGLVHARRDAPAVLVAVVLAVVAASSFDTGLACFAGLAMVAWLRRHGAGTWLLLVAGTVLGACAWLAGNAGAGGLQFAPATQAPLLLRWLAAPFAYALWPAIDVDVAAQVPGTLGAAVAVPMARTWESVFGAFETATWPWLGLGAIGIALFVALAARARRLADNRGITTVGLGLAAFALAAGAVVVARAHYFSQLHPEQLLATGYVVWSVLFWGGLLLAATGLAKQARRAAVLVATVAIVLLPSELWMSQLALRMRAAAERGAAMAANNVVDPNVSIGETVPAELVAAMPLLQRDGAAAYAWPEVAYLGRTLDPAGLAAVATSAWEVTPITGADGHAAVRVAFRTESHARRLLIVDATGIVRGLAIRDRSRPGYWLGWSKDAALSGALQATPLPAH